MIYCVISADAGHDLHETLRRFYRDDPTVEVVVDRRRGERRQDEGSETPCGSTQAERRSGIDRRAAPGSKRPTRLPALAQAELACLSWTERAEPAGGSPEDRDSTRLAVQAGRGDSAAFGALYMRYFDRVYGYLLGVLGDAHTAEDAAQETFERALKSLPRFRGGGGAAFRVWMFKIARSAAVAQLRRNERIVQVQYELLRAAPPGGGDLGEVFAPEDLLARDVTRVMGSLSETQRRVLSLRYSFDLTRAEIGAALGLSSEAVRKHETRALRLLRQRVASLRERQTGRQEMAMRSRARPAPVVAGRRRALMPQPAGHRR